MRRTLFGTSALALAAAAGLMMGCEQMNGGEDDANADDATAAAEMNDIMPASTQAEGIVVNYSVKGMHCGGCAAGVKQTLAKIDGVIGADVSYEESKAVITMRDESMTDDVRKAIEEMGYEVSLASSETDEAAPASTEDAAEA